MRRNHSSARTTAVSRVLKNHESIHGPWLPWAVMFERMYALVIFWYRRPLEEVLTVVDAHRAYLRTLQERGILLASGPFDPRNGGGLLLRVPDDDVQGALNAIRDNDPFTQTGMAEYQLMLPWAPTIGLEALDRM